jgi:intergrase/recombinase
MSTENLIKLPETNEYKTPIINEGALSHEPNLVNRINLVNETNLVNRTNLVNETNFIKRTNLVNKTKRTCVNALNQRLYNSQKKDKFKNRAIIFTIFFSVGIIGFIAG